MNRTFIYVIFVIVFTSFQIVSVHNLEQAYICLIQKDRTNCKITSHKIAHQLKGVLSKLFFLFNFLSLVIFYSLLLFHEHRSWSFESSSVKFLSKSANPSSLDQSMYRIYILKPKIRSIFQQILIDFE